MKYAASVIGHGQQDNRQRRVTLLNLPVSIAHLCRIYIYIYIYGLIKINLDKIIFTLEF